MWLIPLKYINQSLSQSPPPQEASPDMGSNKRSKICLSIFSLLLTATVSAARAAVDLRSDGVSDSFHHVGSSYLRLPTLFSPPDEGGACEQTYGFLPCTKTAFGNLFLILVYGYLMFVGATYLSDGSELLLEILGPGVIGGLFLPILGALPDALLILGNYSNPERWGFF